MHENPGKGCFVPETWLKSGKEKGLVTRSRTPPGDVDPGRRLTEEGGTVKQDRKKVFASKEGHGGGGGGPSTILKYQKGRDDSHLATPVSTTCNKKRENGKTLCVDFSVMAHSKGKVSEGSS